MKLLFKLSLSLTLILASMTIKAADAPTIILKYQDHKSFTLLLNQLDQKIYTIQLKDRAGVSLFKEKLTGQDDFGKIYNLKNLPKGEYVFTIESEQNVFTQVITVEKSSLKMNTGKWDTAYKPHFRHGYDHIDLTFLQLSPSTTKVEILDEFDEVIYTKTLKSVGSICLRFDTQKLDYGNYTFKLTANGRSYFEPFSIKNLMSFQCP